MKAGIALKTIPVDFEKAVMNDLQTEFPLTVLGCNFHFCQCTMRFTKAVRVAEEVQPLAFRLLGVSGFRILQKFFSNTCRLAAFALGKLLSFSVQRAIFRQRTHIMHLAPLDVRQFDQSGAYGASFL